MLTFYRESENLMRCYLRLVCRIGMCGLLMLFQYFLCLIIFISNSIAEDEVSKSDSNTPNIDSAVNGIQVSPGMNRELLEKEREDEVVLPLDSWIIRKNDSVVPSPTPKASLEDVLVEDESEEDLLSKELLEEERRVYNTLLKGYKEGAEKIEKEHATTASKIFKKSALSKLEQKRIERAKKMQKGILREQRAKISHLLPAPEAIPFKLRLCLAEFSHMGFPAEVAQFHKLKPEEASRSVSKVQNNFYKEVFQNECAFVVMTGLVSRTKTKALEFISKANTFLERVNGTSWKGEVSSAEGPAFYSFIYDTSKVNIVSFEELGAIALRRGGVFEEQSFYAAPMEVHFKDVRISSNRLNRIILFDLRNFRQVGTPVKLPHALQMASAVNELINNRSNENPDDVILAGGSVWMDRVTPVHQVLSGYLNLEEFLPDRSCVLKLDSSESSYSCDKAIVKSNSKILFGSISDLLTRFVKMSEHESKRLKKEKRDLFSDIYFSASSIAKGEEVLEKGDGGSFGLNSIGTKKSPARFIWVDMVSGR